MKRKLATAAVATIALGALALGNAAGLIAYGEPGSPNGGFAWQQDETACGLELWGTPGPFCDTGLRTWNGR